MKILLTASEKKDTRLLHKGEVEPYLRTMGRRSKQETAEVTAKPLPPLQAPALPASPWSATSPFQSYSCITTRRRYIEVPSNIQSSDSEILQSSITTKWK